MTGPKVVALGGGHGLAATLGAARTYAGELTAVVSVADDGGSSGRLRRSVGIPAPGDLRRCLVALAEPDSVWARVFDHRFASGDLAGHALGNLIIAGLTEATGDFRSALEEAARLLGSGGRVLPLATAPVTLRASVGGSEVVGEVAVGHRGGPISSVSVGATGGGDARAPDDVMAALAGADQVLIGPGSLFTSVLAACVVPGVREALAARDGGRVYVANLAPEKPETEGMSLADHLAALVDHGVTVDTVVYDPVAFEAAAGAGRCGPIEAAVAGMPSGPGWSLSADMAVTAGHRHDVRRLAAALADLADLAGGGARLP